MKLGIVLAVVLFLGLLTFILPLGGAEIFDNQEWPTFQRDWQRTGYTTAQVSDKLRLLWTFETEGGEAHGSIRGSAAIADGMVYFTSRDGRVYALDAENGSLIWYYQTGSMWGAGKAPSPTVADGRVYVGSWDNYFYALDAGNGELVWKFNVYRPGELYGVNVAPVVIRGRVYVGSWNGYFYCLNAENGGLIWSYSDGNGKMGHVGDSSPAIADGVVYFGTEAGSGENKKDNFDYTGWVYALNIENGDLIWEFPIGDEIGSSPTVVNDRVYIGAGFMGHLPGDGMWALDTRTGDLVWYFDTEEASGENWAPVISSAAVFDGKVYFGSYDDYVYALDAENGALIWKYKANGSVRSSPAVTDNKVFIGGGTKLYVLDANDGSLMWSWDTYYTIYSSPAVAYGKVYIGSSNGKLYCFGPAPPEEGPERQPTSTFLWLGIGALIFTTLVVSLYMLRMRRVRRRYDKL